MGGQDADKSGKPARHERLPAGNEQERQGGLQEEGEDLLPVSSMLGRRLLRRWHHVITHQNSLGGTFCVVLAVGLLFVWGPKCLIGRTVASPFQRRAIF